MNKLEKTLRIGAMVFRSIWMVIAIILWCAGLAVFQGGMNFGYWMIWGFMCSIPMIVEVGKAVIDGTRQGARDGANEYSATIIGNTLYIENHPFRGAVIGFLGSIIGCVLVGPVVLPIYFLAVAFKFITNILDYRRRLKESQ